MKKILAVLVGMLLLLAGAPVLSAQNRKTETVVFKTDIHCQSCKKKLENAIPFEKGVKDMEVDVATKKVKVTFDPTKTNPAKIAEAVKKQGYKAQLVEAPAKTSAGSE